MQDRRERFVRVVESRVNRILDDLDKLGKCANKRNYEYTDEDVKLIFREIKRKVEEVRALFSSTTGDTRRFRLRREEKSAED